MQEEDATVLSISRLLSVRQQAGVERSKEKLASMRKSHGLPDLYSANREAARKAERGELRIASAAWWGWSAENSTAYLNAALSAPLDLLVIPKMAGPWIAGPLFVDGPKSILIESGSEIIAAEGEFHGRGDCLLTIRHNTGLRIEGYGARLAMRKNDYRSALYEPSQWRHAVAILESENIEVSGLSIERSGGDGVYIGQKSGGRVPTNIRLTDLRLSDHFRQGVSVIAAHGFTLEYSTISGTNGHQPQAGIDFEPNRNVYGLVNCKVASCVFQDNAGASIHIHLTHLGASHPPTSIRVTDSIIRGNPVAIWAQGMGPELSGCVEFENNRISGLKIIKKGENMRFLIR